jgi:hypothetical protein
VVEYLRVFGHVGFFCPLREKAMKFRAFVLGADQKHMEIMDIDLTPAELEEIRAMTADYVSRAARTGPRHMVSDDSRTLSDDSMTDTKLFD